LDYDVARTRDRAIPAAAQQESEKAFSRWSMTLSANAIEQGLLDEDLPKPPLVRLDGRQDIVGVAKRLPQDGVDDWHRLPSDAIAGPGRDTCHGFMVRLVRPWSATSIVMTAIGLSRSRGTR